MEIRAWILVLVFYWEQFGSFVLSKALLFRRDVDLLGGWVQDLKAFVFYYVLEVKAFKTFTWHCFHLILYNAWVQLSLAELNEPVFWQVVKVKLFSWVILHTHYLSLTSNMLTEHFYLFVVVDCLVRLVGSRPRLWIIRWHLHLLIIIQNCSKLHSNICITR